jgi:hydroxymethylpyrimidine/phosphomethylpyrimidine kinase
MTKHNSIARVLVIAGSDSGGGAGIQADIKTITALAGYATTAVTALTAQNTEGVFGIHDVPDAFIAQQMRVVLEDIGADAIKIGMLHTASVIQTVADVLADYPDIPLIIDPVMVAKGGAPLLEQSAIDILKQKLISRAMLITPNIPEAELLTGYRLQVTSIKEMQEMGEAMLTLGAKAVLIKGGHMDSEEITDCLAYNLQPVIYNHFSSPRIHTRHTHGTGCTLASAIATGIAQGMGLKESVIRARAYVQKAIRSAPGLGKGHGPLGYGLL